MKLVSKLSCIAATVLAVAGFSAPAQAIAFLDPGRGSAEVTFSGNTLNVSLTSLITNPTTTAEALSGFYITLQTAPTAASLGSQTGQRINIEKAPKTCGPKGNQTCPNIVTPVAGDPDHWRVDMDGSELELITVGFGGGRPYDLILGDNGDFSNANSQLANHSPDIKGTGYFGITLPNGFDPIILGVMFEYGTGPHIFSDLLTGSCGTSGCDMNPPGQQQDVRPTAVPEPSSWAMMLAGFAGLGLMMRRSRRKQATARA